MNTIQSTLAHNIRTVRKKLRYTQQQLSEKCNISRIYISEIERGTKYPSPDVLERISRALNVKTYQLFMDEEDFFRFDKMARLDKLQANLTGILQKSIEVYLNE